MRLWSLHPKYLDARGLVALWREALLAQAVLAGQTRGYRHHPQLTRLRQSPEPEAYVASYLAAVQAEASRRGYSFDAAKIGPTRCLAPLTVASGQLQYEWGHLIQKLRVRAPAWLSGLDGASSPSPHPLFRVVAGPVETWEVIRTPPQDLP